MPRSSAICEWAARHPIEESDAHECRDGSKAGMSRTTNAWVLPTEPPTPTAKAFRFAFIGLAQTGRTKSNQPCQLAPSVPRRSVR